MFKNNKKKANKNFQKASKEYEAFLNSLIEMGYGEYTDKRLKEEGRKDLYLKGIKLKENFCKATEELLEAYK